MEGTIVPSAIDVGAYILAKRGPMTAMKLQKLVYYCQVWSVVWDDDVLFPEPIEAWKNGPVVRALWEAHRGQFRVQVLPDGDPNALSGGQRETIDRVLSYYGAKDAQWLSDLTHMEAPWAEAMERSREGGNAVISLERISEYYSSLAPDEPA